MGRCNIGTGSCSSRSRCCGRVVVVVGVVCNGIGSCSGSGSCSGISNCSGRGSGRGSGSGSFIGRGSCGRTQDSRLGQIQFR